MLGLAAARGAVSTPSSLLPALFSNSLCRRCCRAVSNSISGSLVSPTARSQRDVHVRLCDRQLGAQTLPVAPLLSWAFPAARPQKIKSGPYRPSHFLAFRYATSFNSSSAQYYATRPPVRLRTRASARSSGHIDEEDLNTLARGPGRPRTLAHAVFAASTCLAAYIGAAYVYEKRAAAVHYAKPDNFFRQMDQLHRYMEDLIWQTFGGELGTRRQRLYPPPSNELERAIQIGKGWWDHLAEAEKTVYGIMAINAIVFLLWQVPALHPFMCKMFLHTPSSGNPVTLLTSMFSHHDLWHFGFNMFALCSLGETVCRLMGTEQFLATYLSAGVCSSFFSHLLRTRLNIESHVGGLGASGALYSCFALVAMAYPDATGTIIFLPVIPLSLKTMLPLMVAVDVLGIIRRWKIFDHYAHLGGALFGAAYHYYGRDVWKGSREWAVALQRRMEKA